MSRTAFDFAQGFTVESDPEWLLRSLHDAAAGSFPAPDHRVRLTPVPTGTKAAVIAFTGHHVIASALGAEVVADELERTHTQLPTDPRFLTWLATVTGGSSSEDTIDVVLARSGIAADGLARMEPFDESMLDDERIAFAAETRANLKVHRTDAGVVVLGRGLAGRLEMSIELAATNRGRGRAGELARVALAEAGPAQTVFAQISAGNSAALRAAWSAGFAPICAEFLVR